MSNFMNDYFGPIKNKNACLYFYIMSMFSGVLFVTMIVLFIYSSFQTSKLPSFMTTYNFIVLLMYTFLAYFINRLLNTMCMNSIR